MLSQLEKHAIAKGHSVCLNVCVWLAARPYGILVSHAYAVQVIEIHFTPSMIEQCF